MTVKLEGSGVGATDYARAEGFLAWNAERLVLGAHLEPQWLHDGTDRFWYLRRSRQGSRFLLVDPSQGTREPAFDHAQLAEALSRATGSAYEADRLPFEPIELTPESG